MYLIFYSYVACFLRTSTKINKTWKRLQEVFFVSIFVTYLPDRKYWEEDDCDINKLGYELGGTSYSGTSMVSSLDGILIHGAKFDNLLYVIFMNKLKLLLLGLMLFPMCIFSQVKTTNEDELGSAIFTLDSEGIISTNNAMIDPFDLTGYDINSLSYTPKDPVSLLVGNSTITVKTSIFEDWDNNKDRGFNVISLYKNEAKIFELKQLESWTYTYDGVCTYDYRKYTNNRLFIPVKLSNNVTAIAFVGMPYGGDLPYLTILVVTEQDAKLVFNKNRGLDSIVKSDNQCVIKVQTGLEEYDSNGKLCVAPVFARMYLENGVLYLNK